MRALISALVIGLSLAACTQEVQVVDENALIYRDGVAYVAATNELFSGVVTANHENGQLRSRVNFVDGKKLGVEERFYANGQLEARISYFDGRLGGLVETFDENGELVEQLNVLPEY